MTWHGGVRGTPSSALIILYYPKWGLGVPSNIYRGPRGPPFAVKGFPPFFTGVPGDPCSGVDGFPPFSTWVPWSWRVSRCVFCKHFAAGREEGCSVPLVFARAHASHVMVPSTFHMGPQALACVQVSFLQAFRCSLGGRV